MLQHVQFLRLNKYIYIYIYIYLILKTVHVATCTIFKIK